MRINSAVLLYSVDDEIDQPFSSKSRFKPG